MERGTPDKAIETESVGDRGLASGEGLFSDDEGSEIRND